MVSMPHWPKKMISHPEISDLSRILSIMDALGNPHLSIPNVIHIAGTNGKGSSCAMLKSTLQASNYKIHQYTSPHLLEFNERIVISNEIISDDLLYIYFEEVRFACERINLEPTFFEATTAAAFLAFSKHKADFLILETGLGGRLDPTNIIPKPLLTIITSISYDHMEYLGYEIGLIAREKAGIIKEKVPCVIGRQDQRVMDIMLGVCEERNSAAIAYEYDFIAEKLEKGFSFESRLGDLIIEEFSLLGDHQIINASAVLASLLFLKSKFPQITEESIKSGMRNAYWRGRLEEVSLNKIVKNSKNSRCFIDGAHNIAGAASLAEWIKSQNFKNIVIIIGLTKNRDVYSILSQFTDISEQSKLTFISVKVLSEPLSYSAEKLSELAGQNNIAVKPCDSLYDALEEAVSIDDSTIIITGSLFLISDFYKLIRG
jgi:dihydrofolate synthase/folylpolyglutamate synthase